MGCLALSKTDARQLLKCQNALCYYTSVMSTLICPCDELARSLPDTDELLLFFFFWGGGALPEMQSGPMENSIS